MKSSHQNVLINFPTGDKARKALPITTGVLDYFPAAIADVAECSRIANDQHNPGQPLHWARGKSIDQANTLVRHLIQRGTRDTDGVRHSAKVAWRALALLQEEIEAEEGFIPGQTIAILHRTRKQELQDFRDDNAHHMTRKQIARIEMAIANEK